MNREITLYITKDSPFSMACGGVNRATLWFTKPEYYDNSSEVEINESDRIPFGDYGSIGSGWDAHSIATDNIPVESLRKQLGYDHPIINDIWSKITATYSIDYKEQEAFFIAANAGTVEKEGMLYNQWIGEIRVRLELASFKVL